MIDKTYSTAQVSGMTSIPPRTIQDYVKAFRDCFSETARQTKKGRRFTDADIKNLLTIKRARAQRFPDDDIRKILSGEIVLPLAQEYQADDIKKIAVTAAENIERTIGLMNSFDEEMENMRKAQGNIWITVNDLKKEVVTLQKKMDDFRSWQIFMMKNYTEFNPYHDTKDPAEEPTAQDAKPVERKKAGFMGWLNGG